MKEFNLTRTVQVLLLLFLVFAGLVYAKPFLVPVAFAALFSMLFLPLSVKMQNKGIGKAVSILLCIFILLFAISLIMGLLAWQVSSMAEDANQIQQNVTKKIEQLRQYLSNNFGISRQKQKEIIKNGQQQGQAGSTLTGFLATAGSFLTDFILMLVYIFLFMYYKGHLKKFILILVPHQKREKTSRALSDSRKVAEKYLSGMAVMIACLWVMYSIGFSIVGVKNAFFFAILCGLLEIIPFVGNLLGNLITTLMVIAQGGAFTMILGVLATYAIVQFIQTYLLEPLVVGAGVNLNPLFTILGLVLGELLWGIPGMVLAIPILGIAKIVFDNVEDLKPYGYLLGEDKKKGESNFVDKIKGWFGKKKKALSEKG